MKSNTSLKSIIVLVSICLLIAVLMAAVNIVTAPKIAAAELEAKQAALAEVLPENDGFEKVELDGLPEGVSEVYRDKDGEGYVVLISAKGYDSSNPISAAVGFTDSGEIAKMFVISCSGETAGIGSKVGEASFLDIFSGKGSELSGVDAISGATISSSAVIDAVKGAFAALNMAKEAGK